MKKLLCYIICIIGFTSAFGERLDSLQTALKTAEGAAKVKIMNELFGEYIYSDPVKAIGYSREALTLAAAIDDHKGEAAAYNNIGISYRNQGALDMALEYYMKSLEIYTSIQNGEGVATTKNNIANLYSSKKDYGQALKYFEESHNGFIALGNTDRIIGSMNNLGNLHSDLQLYDQALNYYSEAWKMSEKTGHPLADPLSNIGNLFYRQGNYQRAVEYYQRALEIVTKQNNKLSELALLANIGEVYARAGQPVPAQKYLDDAMRLAVDQGASLYKPQILKSMSLNYAKQGKHKEAYDMMIKYDEAREKVYGEESSRRIAQMDVALQLKEREKEVDVLEADDKVKTLQLRNTQFVVIAIVLAVISIVAFMNLFFRSKGSRKRPA